MSHAEIVSRRLWSDWFFERVSLPPALFGALLATGLVALLCARRRHRGIRPARRAQPRLVAEPRRPDRRAGLAARGHAAHRAVPLLGWVGAAVVQHVLDAALG
jgi:hypothetical protein